MRNLLEYPVTYLEAIQVLDELIVESFKDDLSCGDMRPVVLQWIKEKILQELNKE